MTEKSKKQCLNCGFIDEIETLDSGWGSLEKIGQECRKCGSRAYRYISLDEIKEK